MQNPVHLIAYDRSPKGDYPYLADLMGGWFHQDFELAGGPTYQGVIAAFVGDVGAAEREKTVADIRRFLLDFGATDAGLAEAMDRVFSPDVLVEGWDGLTTREWLMDVARLIAAG